MGVGGQSHASAALPPGKRRYTHCIGGWVGHTAGLDGCGKSRPHRVSIPGPSSPNESLYTKSNTDTPPVVMFRNVRRMSEIITDAANFTYIHTHIHTHTHINTYIHTYITYIHTYTHKIESDCSCNPDSSTLDTVRQQHDLPAANVITQQYSSTTSVSSLFHSHNENCTYFKLRYVCKLVLKSCKSCKTFLFFRKLCRL